jgi:hypothetical protein
MCLALVVRPEGASRNKRLALKGLGLKGECNRREVRLYQPSEKRPRTKDDDEDDWEMTLYTYLNVILFVAVRQM